MSAQSVFAALLVALLFNACVSLESKWRWNGITVQDEAAIRAALRRITNSPIVELQPRNEGDSPNKIMFYTADDKIYEAEKMHGEWHITDITNAIVYCEPDLTRQWSEPLPVACSTFK